MRNKNVATDLPSQNATNIIRDPRFDLGLSQGYRQGNATSWTVNEKMLDINEINEDKTTCN